MLAHEKNKTEGIGLATILLTPIHLNFLKYFSSQIYL